MDSARKDAEDAHKWRQDCADVCGMLTLRLKELAEFLDSLLKHKDILGVLAQDRRKVRFIQRLFFDFFSPFPYSLAGHA